MIHKRRTILLGLAGTVWLTVVGVGLMRLWEYSNTPGPAAEAPERWPAADVALDRSRYTLLLFLHPYCDCSRATTGELEKLVARAGTRLSIHAWIFQPKTADPTWSETQVRHTVEAIPGVHVHTDTDAEEARVFGARVSGQTLLYSPAGQLMFAGGITSQRGHAGDNDGVEALVGAANGTPSLGRTPVFGCLLRGPATDPASLRTSRE